MIRPRSILPVQAIQQQNLFHKKQQPSVSRKNRIETLVKDTEERTANSENFVSRFLLKSEAEMGKICRKPLIFGWRITAETV